MARIQESLSMPFGASEMYEIVNDVKSYPEFLPWCFDSEILYQDDSKMRATISIRKGGFSYSLTTSNLLMPGRSIVLDFSEGPFKYLRGEWRFIPTEGGSSVNLELDFEAENRILDIALGAASGRVTAKLMKSFEDRAYALYG